MRIRNVLTALGTAVALVGLSATPAAAGTGPSQWCTDGVGWFGQGVTNPVTLSVELYESPTNTNHQTLWLCYSTSATTTPGSIIGGAVGLDIYTDTGTTTPGAYVALHCAGDSGVSVGPLSCFYPNSANAAPGEVQGTPAGGVCLVALNGWCQYYVTGLAAYTNASPHPLLHIMLVGVPVPVSLPAQCVGILSGC
ncbi:MAG TPA: hypothetical protein VNA20_13870 [Frankiaceae bacterium]|nr:hypothetical protein [Frankiaceae bacterium]